MRRVFQLCTCLWGGIFNPIIPVCDAIPEAWIDPFDAPSSPAELARGYIEFYEPDVFVEARSGMSAQIGIPPRDVDPIHPRILPLDSFFSEANPYPFALPFGLDCFGIYKAMYEREFKFVARHGRSSVAHFESSSGESLFFEAVFGAFPTDGPMKRLARDYDDAFDPVSLAPSIEDWMRAIRDDFRSPLSFTVEGLKRDFHGWSEPTLLIVDPTSPLDLIDFWNMRQFHPQVLPVSVTWLRDVTDLLRELVKANHRPLLGNADGVAIQTAVQLGRSLMTGGRETATAIGKALFSEMGLADFADTHWSRHEPVWIPDREDSIHRPQRAEIECAATDLELAISGEGSTQYCRFKSLSPDFASAFAEAGGARWANVLKLRGYGSNDGLALALPSSFTAVAGGRLRLGEPAVVSREGIVLLQTSKHHLEWVNLLTGEQAFSEWLEHAGAPSKRSESGRIAEQMLESLGGFWGTSLVAHRETLQLLDDMAKSVRTYADGTVEEYQDRSATVKRWQDLLSRRSGGPRGYRTAATLDRFIEANVLRLGLELTCTNCGKRNWVGIASLKEQLVCERCLKAFAFPQGSLDFHHTPWRYRVIGPYSVPDYADGAYSTILALTVFARRLGSDQPNMTYTTGLEFRNGEDKPFEVDFGLWYQRTRMFGRNEEPVLVFGEAKSFGTECFEEADVARMRKLAEKFPGAFIVFATLKDEMSENEAKRIGEFAMWGREDLGDGLPRTPVIALTGAEMFCDWSLEWTWKELGGQRAALVAPPAAQLGNLHRLARFTQHVYLGLPLHRAPRGPAASTQP